MSDPSAYPLSECPSCGAPVPAGAPEGQCARCLLLAVSDSGDPSSEFGGNADETLPFTPRESAPPSTKPALSAPVAADTLIGPYRLGEKLGEGGFGVVWKAEQTSPLKRTVALKLVKPGFDSAEITARFALEKQALAVMDHPNIARILDAGVSEEGRPYFVMELVEGMPLTRYCDENRLPLRKRLELFRQVCQAVQHAHQKGIIHRDLKPSNILVATDDAGKPVPKVIDFGIAKALTPGLSEEALTLHSLSIMGTPVYMSPEQALGDRDIDTRTDLYSLGVILYELLTGQPPLDHRELMKRAIDEILRIIREEEPRKPSTRVGTLEKETATHVAEVRGLTSGRLTGLLQGDLDWIVLKALAKERDRRYETAAALAEDVRRHMEGEPVEAAPPGVAYFLGKFVRKHRVPVGAAAVVLLSMVVAVIVSMRFAADAKRESRRAEAKTTEAQDSKRKAYSFVKEAANKSWTASREATNRPGNPDHRAGLAHLADALRYNQSLPLEMRFPMMPQDAAMRLARMPPLDPFPIRPPLPLISVPNCLAFSNDGRFAAVGGEDGTMRMLDLSTGKLFGGTMRHSERITSCIFSGGGTLLASTSSDLTARIWDSATQTLLREMVGHRAWITGAVFSPNSKYLVTASMDHTARIWDIETGTPRFEPLRHSHRVNGVSMRADGKILVTASDDHSAQLWSLETGESIGPPLPHSSAVLAASFSPDGSKLLTVSGKAANLWNLPKDLATKCHDPIQLSHSGRVSCAAFSPDGTLVATGGSDLTARLWDTATGDPVGDKMEHPQAVPSVSFSVDGGRLLTVCGSLEGTSEVRLWDTVTGRPSSPPFRHDSFIMAAGISPDRNAIVTASRDRFLRIWSAATGGPYPLTLRTAGGVGKVAASPDGKYLVSVGQASAATLWSVEKGFTELRSFPHEGRVRNCAFSGDGLRIATIGNDRTARIWNVTDGSSQGPPLMHDEEPYYVTFDPSGTLLATVSKQFLSVWNLDSGKLLFPSFKSTLPLGRAAFSPDGSRLLVLRDYDALLLSSTTGEMLGTAMEHQDLLTDAGFSPGGTRIVTASEDQTVRVWAADSGEPVGAPLNFGCSVERAAFHNSEDRLFIASYDGVCRFWDLLSGKSVGPILRHLKGYPSQTDPVKEFQFGHNGELLFTLTFSGFVHTWSVSEGRELGLPIKYPGSGSLALSPNDRFVVVCGSQLDAFAFAQVWNTGYCRDGEPAISALEAIGGIGIDAKGILRPLSYEQRVSAMKSARATAAGLTDWGNLTRWCFEPIDKRSLFPGLMLDTSAAIARDLAWAAANPRHRNAAMTISDARAVIPSAPLLSHAIGAVWGTARNESGTGGREPLSEGPISLKPLPIRPSVALPVQVKAEIHEEDSTGKGAEFVGSWNVSISVTNQSKSDLRDITVSSMIYFYPECEPDHLGRTVPVGPLSVQIELHPIEVLKPGQSVHFNQSTGDYATGGAPLADVLKGFRVLVRSSDGRELGSTVQPESMTLPLDWEDK